MIQKVYEDTTTINEYNVSIILFELDAENEYEAVVELMRYEDGVEYTESFFITNDDTEQAIEKAWSYTQEWIDGLGWDND
jgi:hypothetical protein